MSSKLSILRQWPFLLALFLLLLNDFYLKAVYHNFGTGKLSDFAGLFVFAVFFYALLPKWKNQIFIGTALFFIYWKSSYAEAFINFWNQYAPFAIGRVVDYSDLWALMILPIAYWFTEDSSTKFAKLRIAYPIPLCLSIFAFMATSYRSIIEAPKGTTYHFNYSIDTLKKRIFLHPNIPNFYADNWGTDSVVYEMDSLDAYFYSDTLVLNAAASPLIYISGNKDSSKIELQHFIIRAPKGNKKQQKAIQDTLMYDFEKQIIEKLHDQL